MVKDGKYRFSLQFGMRSEEEVRAGELLERLGNKKSTVIVAALNEYLSAHPEVAQKNCKVQVQFTGLQVSQLETLVEKKVEEYFSSRQIEKAQFTEKETKEESTKPTQDILDMLSDLELFGV